MTQRKIRFIFLLLVGLLLAAGSVQAMASGTYRLDWSVPFSGSGGVSQSQTYRAEFTLGQAAHQIMAGQNTTAKMGYWSGAIDRHFIFLPVTAKYP